MNSSSSSSSSTSSATATAIATEIKHVEIEIISKDLDEKTVCLSDCNEKKDEEALPANLTELFYLADIKDKFYITCGISTAIISGIIVIITVYCHHHSF